MTDRNALPTSWPSPRTDPPDDDPEGIEAAAEWQHDCDAERCITCVACNFERNVKVCQFTCEHRGDLS